MDKSKYEKLKKIAPAFLVGLIVISGATAW